MVTKETTITTGARGKNTNTLRSSSSGEEKVTNSQTIGYIIYFLFGFLEILLIFRLVFKVTGANPISSFVSFIYLLTQIAIQPFFGIFHQATTRGVETTAVFEP